MAETTIVYEPTAEDISYWSSDVPKTSRSIAETSDGQLFDVSVLIGEYGMKSIILTEYVSIHCK